MACRTWQTDSLLLPNLRTKRKPIHPSINHLPEHDHTDAAGDARRYEPRYGQRAEHGRLDVSSFAFGVCVHLRVFLLALLLLLLLRVCYSFVVEWRLHWRQHDYVLHRAAWEITRDARREKKIANNAAVRRMSESVSKNAKTIIDIRCVC